ncbi:hypothetical protein JCM16303_001466 [Sporobolomyces ruberrimus]
MSRSSTIPDQVELPLLGTTSSSAPLRPRHRRPSLVRLLSRIALPALALTFLSLVYLSSTSSTGFGKEQGIDLEEWIHRNRSNVNVFDNLEIQSEDGNMKAVFFALGASMNELHVKDRNGNMRDIIVGYRDPHSALNSSSYAYFNSLIGRYANRISHSSFTSPLTNETFHLPVNEGESTTLHGGKWGYSRSGWKVEKHQGNEIVFSLIDKGAEGFPGTVKTFATYTLLSQPSRLRTHLTSQVLSPLPLITPISLSSHVYFNLDGYSSNSGKEVGGGMRVWIDSKRNVEVDERLIPTGKLLEVERDGPLNFVKERELKEVVEDERSEGLCGKNCKGLDNALIYSNPERDPKEKVVMTLSCPSSGIRMNIRTNQPLVHLYSCNSPHFSSTSGSYPFKRTQNDGREGTYGRSSCLAIEQEGWIDGLHHGEEWGLKGEKSQWYDLDRDYKWWTEYEFENF